MWKDESKGPSAAVKAKCLSYYDAFYAKLREVCTRLESEFGAFVVLDLHSYNHRRAGPQAPCADQLQNPDINVGTSNMDRSRWGPLVDRFCAELSAAGQYSKSSVTAFAGGKADVRQNVRFKGGAICQWIHTNFPNSGQAPAPSARPLPLRRLHPLPSALRLLYCSPLLPALSAVPLCPSASRARARAHAMCRSAAPHSSLRARSALLRCALLCCAPCRVVCRVPCAVCARLQVVRWRLSSRSFGWMNGQASKIRSATTVPRGAMQRNAAQCSAMQRGLSLECRVLRACVDCGGGALHRC